MEIKQRINRIIGQLKGVERMVGEKRDCSEILQQVSAIKKAIDGLSKGIMVSGVCRFVAKKNIKEVEKMVERAINL
jgi:CsoR family transcriptional regulator, copper-sensing transcriptional repressor